MIKVFALGEDANEAVRTFQEAGSGMIDEFIYVRLDSPAGSGDISETTLESLREATSGAHLLVAVVSSDTPESLIPLQASLLALAGNERLVVCIPYPLPGIHTFEASRIGENAVAFIEGLVGTPSKLESRVDVSDSLHHCIRTLTDLLDSDMIGIDFDDLQLATRDAQFCRFSRGLGEVEDSGAVVQKAISGLDRNGTSTGGIVSGVVALIEAERDSLKMREYKFVVEGLREAFGTGIPFAVNMITRESMASGNVAVNLIVASAANAGT